MILPNANDAVHKAWLYRVLTALLDDERVAPFLAFKGGTCAAMLGWLDRFSIDLDFDFIGIRREIENVRVAMRDDITALGMSVRDESKRVPQFFLRYPVTTLGRSSMKIDVTFPPPHANVYTPIRLMDIDRVARCQTLETMVANKLVAFMERFEQREMIAARDLYDTHHFFMEGFRYNEDVIRERRGQSISDFFAALIDFVEQRVTQRIIDQDLNVLLPPDRFQRLRTVLKRETLIFLRDELTRVRAQKTLNISHGGRN